LKEIGMLKKVFSYAFRFAISPGKASEKISADPVGVWAGFWWAVLFLGAYSLCVLIFYLLGHEPVTQGWLTVPMEKWYLVQTFTTMPIGLGGFLSYGGLAYLLSRAAGGRGSFEATFASQMYALIIPCVVFMLLLELFIAPPMIALGMTVVPWPQWVEMLRVFVLPFAWIFFMSTIALMKIHGIRWYAAIAFSVISMIPCGVIMSVFIR
jgi:hypothetical protein